MQDLTIKADQTAVDYCAFCPKLCRFSCPVSQAEGRETVTPWNKVSMLRFIREGQIDLNQTSAELFYKCTDCRRCQSFCLHNNDVPSMLTAGRQVAMAQGVAPLAVTHFCATAKTELRPLSPKLRERLREVAPAQAFQNKTQTKVAFFPGCSTIKYRPELLSQTWTLFEKLGIDITFFDGSVQCGGYPLYAAGDVGQFHELVDALALAFEPFETIVSGCPACTWLIQKQWGKHARSVTSLTDFLIPYMENYRKAHPPLTDQALYYHDSCFLGRYLEQYENPRHLLSLGGVSVVEFPQNRQHSECCGAGGLLPLTSPETAKMASSTRLKYAQSTQATGIVAACSSCTHAFSKTNSPLPVYDLVDVLLQSL